jgi:hypothetical protein
MTLRVVQKSFQFLDHAFPLTSLRRMSLSNRSVHRPHERFKLD